MVHAVAGAKNMQQHQQILFQPFCAHEIYLRHKQSIFSQHLSITVNQIPQEAFLEILARIFSSQTGMVAIKHDPFLGSIGSILHFFQMDPTAQVGCIHNFRQLWARGERFGVALVATGCYLEFSFKFQGVPKSAPKEKGIEKTWKLPSKLLRYIRRTRTCFGRLFWNSNDFQQMLF